MKDLQPLVSLLIPIYGVELYIERCARALFSQTYANIEYVFVDDCSPDGSVDLLKKVLAEFPERLPQVRIVRHECNRGLAAARSTAIGYAAGEWVLMHDSDDWLEPDAVERLVGAVDQDIDMVSCDYYQGTYPCNREVRRQHQRPTNGVEWLYAALEEGSDVRWMVWNKLLRRSLFEYPGVGWTQGADMAEDFGIMARLSCHICSIKHLEIPLVHYLTRPDSFCHGKRTLRDDLGYCQNIINGVAYIHQMGLAKEFEQAIISFLIHHQYHVLWENGIDHKECLVMLPSPKWWQPKRKIGLSFRKRLIVFCGYHGWKFPTLALMSISAEWRRLQRQKK